MKKIKTKIPFLILLFLAFLAAWPLLKPGFIPTHDGEYHLIRFWQFDKNIRSGILFPRWAPDLDKGFGVPIFSFFYPFPNYAAEIFILLGSSLTNAFKLSQALAFILSGLFFYLWLKQSFKKWPSLVGAVFYLYAPYHFLDLYVRGSIGEVWALVWLPAVLWSSQQMTKTNKTKYLILTAIFFAFLILSHNILALLFSVFLLSWFILSWWFFNCSANTSMIRIIEVKKRKLFIAFSLGLGLSCYFWLPALMERKFVSGLELINFTDHFPALFQLIFPSWGTGFSVPGILDEMSFQIGFDHLLVALLTLFIILKRRKFDKIPIFFLIWFFLLIFFSLEISLPLWRSIPIMAYFQYPWRLNSLIIVITSFLAGWISFRFNKRLVTFLLIMIAILLNWRYARPVIYSPREDSFYLENPDWTQGTATLGNSFQTKWAKEHKVYQNKLEIISGRGEVKENFIKPTRYSYSINTQTETKIRVNTNYYPGWQVKTNGQKQKTNLESDGAFSFVLPEGSDQILVDLQEMPLRLLADIISVSSFIFLLGVLKLRKNESYS